MVRSVKTHQVNELFPMVLLFLLFVPLGQVNNVLNHVFRLKIPKSVSGLFFHVMLKSWPILAIQVNYFACNIHLLRIALHWTSKHIDGHMEIDQNTHAHKQFEWMIVSTDDHFTFIIWID